MLSESEWGSVVDLLTILKPFDKYTKKLQSETVTMSDFFGFWTSLRLKLAKRSDQFAVSLLEEMNERHDLLLENPVILGAIFLDPRYQRTLRHRKKTAIEFLVNMFLRIEDVISDNMNENNAEKNHEIVDDGNDSEEELNAYLAACSSVTNQTVSNETLIESKRQKIEALLIGFDGTEQPGSISVLQYWEENKHQKPELYRLASAIFTIPPTQTTVERAFSSFAIVFTSHRSRLNSNTLQNILLIRLNYDIYAENFLNYDFENDDILCNNN